MFLRVIMVKLVSELLVAVLVIGTVFVADVVLNEHLRLIDVLLAVVLMLMLFLFFFVILAEAPLEFIDPLRSHHLFDHVGEFHKGTVV